MTRHAHLGSRDARMKLKVRAAPHYGTPFGVGTSLGYRRMRGAGSWVLRRYLGEQRYAAKAFAFADDLDKADGIRILDFHQAETRARELAKEHAERERLEAAGPVLTVARAVEEYVTARERRWVPLSGPRGDARARLRKDVLADEKLAATPLALLTTEGLAAVRSRIGERTAHDLKAALNGGAKRYREKLPPALRDIIKDGLASPGSAPAVAREAPALPDHDIRRLVAAAQEIDAEGGWGGELARLTLVMSAVGARFSQLVRMTVGDVLPAQRKLMIPVSRKGRGAKRLSHIGVPVGQDVLDALKPVTVGRKGHEMLFLRPHLVPLGVGAWTKTGERPWGSPAEFARPWSLVVARAGLPANLTPYSLRHSSILRGLRAGLPTRLVAQLHDTSSEMIESSYSHHISDALSELAERAIIPLLPVAPSPIRAVR
jgi:integrase